MRDCYDSNSIYEHPYLCVVANFQPIDAIKNPQEIEIEYEYISENLIRKREKPFQNKEEENVIVWIYDNNKEDSNIDSLTLSFKFEDKLGEDKIIAYPEKFLIKNSTFSDSFVLNWNIKNFKSHSFKNFAINIPLFNGACQGMVYFFQLE